MTPWPMTPDEALAFLLDGNTRFVAGEADHPNQDAARREASANAQRPFAALFGCSDSRVAAEIVFDRGLGDLFVVRTAGHLVGAEVLASIEYAVAVLDVPLVVVLSHDSCGAVTAAVQAHESGVTPPGHLRHIVERLTPEVLAARAKGITDVDDIARLNGIATAQTLVDQSALLRERVDAGTCGVAVLAYQLVDGRTHIVDGRGLTASVPTLQSSSGGSERWRMSAGGGVERW
jgi:carbonic anhydrase